MRKSKNLTKDGRHSTTVGDAPMVQKNETFLNIITIYLELEFW